MESIDWAYRMLRNDVSISPNSSETVEEFWTRARRSSNHYDKLCAFIFDILTLPVSTADVERVFSSVSFIKNKCRNRLHLTSLEPILSLKAGLKFLGKEGHSFDASEILTSELRTSITRTSFTEDETNPESEVLSSEEV